MTKAGPRGPLKQVRLGVVQKKVLIVLIGVRMQRQRLGEPFTGLSYKDIHARLYNQAFIGESQWLQTVHAQIQRERGNFQVANQLLLDGISRAVTALKESWYSPAPGPHPMSREYEALVDNMENEFSRIGKLASLLRHAGADADQDTLYTTALSLAREIASFVPSSLMGYPDRFMTLTEAEKTAALKTVNVQQASLSRALRGLSEHGLVKQEMVSINHLMDRERRYSITEHGEERFQEEAQKANGRQRHSLFSR